MYQQEIVTLLKAGKVDKASRFINLNLDGLSLILNQFKTLREVSAEDNGFTLLYDSVVNALAMPQANDKQLFEQIIRLLGYYELVKRTQYQGFFFGPHDPAHYFIFSLALYLAGKTGQSINSILYARSLSWPQKMGDWDDPIMGTKDLLLGLDEFAITSEGEICQFDFLINTAVKLFSEGHRDLNKIWQSNDPRRLNKTLSTSFIQALGRHFPVFKEFYDHTLSSSLHTPLGRLNALRVGLSNGSKSGHDEQSKGEEYNAGVAANVAIARFSTWWNDARFIAYGQNQTLQQVLSSLETGHRTGRSLGGLLKIILRDESAHITEGMKNAVTCVQLRGDELQVAIELNRDFLLSFETKGLTDTVLNDYKVKILSAFKQNQQKQSLETQLPQGDSLIISSEPHQLPYFAYAVTQLWEGFCHGEINDASIVELAELLALISDAQREQLWRHEFDFYSNETTKLTNLRHSLRSIEERAEQNILLPPSEQYQLSPVGNALIEILGFNQSLLRWVTQRYEFLIFTNPLLANLMLKEGVDVVVGMGNLVIRDSFNLAYYAYIKSKHLNNSITIQKKLLHSVLGVPDLTVTSLPLSPIHLQIVNDNFAACEQLINEDANYLTHVDWKTGDSPLAMAAKNNREEICRLLLEQGANPQNKNLQGKTAEELWPHSEDSNPILKFRDELRHFATNDEHLNQNRKNELLALVMQNLHLLTWQLDKHQNNLVHYAFLTNHTFITASLINHPQWDYLSNIRNKYGRSLFDTIAWGGHLEYYSYLKHLPKNLGQWWYALKFAVIHKREAFCKQILDDGFISPDKVFGGETALTIAASKGYGSLCTLFLHYGANPGFKNSRDKTAEELWLYSKADNPVVKCRNELIDFGLNKGHLSQTRKNELLALVMKNYHLLTWALDAEHNNLAHLAFFTNHTFITASLINHPQWLYLSFSRNKYGDSLFDKIVCGGHLEYYSYLNHLPKNLGQWWDALIHAINHHREAFCERILEDGFISPDMVFAGETALTVAATKGYGSLCTLFLNYGGNPAFKNRQGKTAEELWPYSKADNPIVKCRNELIDFGLNKGHLSQTRKSQLLALVMKNYHFLSWALDENHYNLVHYAFYANHDFIIKPILNHPQWHDLSKITNNRGDSLFDVIACQGFLEYYDCLKQLPKNHFEWGYALNNAVINNHEAFCKRLLADSVRGLDVGFGGETALMAAARKGYGSICTLLLQYGANPAFKNRQGKTTEELWPKSSAFNPFLNLILERRKNQLINLMQAEMPPILLTKMAVSAQTKAQLNDLRQKITQAEPHSADDPHISADDILSEIINNWEMENPQFNRNWQLPFFSSDNNSSGLIPRILARIKSSLEPTQNREPRERQFLQNVSLSHSRINS